MRKLVRHLIYVLAMLSFVGVSTGIAFAAHLNLQQAEPGCCHDSHDHSDNESPEKDEHDSRQCITCQKLGMIAKRILIESPSIIPELTVIKHDRLYTINQYSNSYTFPPLQPRAPPA